MTPLLIITCRERGGRRQSPGGQLDPGSEAKTGTGEEGKSKTRGQLCPTMQNQIRRSVGS